MYIYIPKRKEVDRYLQTYYIKLYKNNIIVLYNYLQYLWIMYIVPIRVLLDK